MSRRKGTVKRGLAFLLTLALMLGNINIGTAQAAVWDSQDVSDIVDISHTLTENGTAALIQVSEANPNVRIRNVKMVRGHVVIATDANAGKEDMNGVLATEPAMAEPGVLDSLQVEPTQAGPGTTEPAVTESSPVEPTKAEPGLTEPAAPQSSPVDPAMEGPGETTAPESSAADTTTAAVTDGTTAAVTDGTTAAVTDGTTAAVTDGTTAAVTDGTTAAVTDGTTAAVTDGTTAAVTDGTTAAVTDGTTAAVTDGTTAAVTDGTTAAVTDGTTVAVTDGTTAAVTDGTTAAVTDGTTAAVTDGTTAAVTDPTKAAAADATTTEADNQGKAAVADAAKAEADNQGKAAVADAAKAEADNQAKAAVTDAATASNQEKTAVDNAATAAVDPTTTAVTDPTAADPENTNPTTADPGTDKPIATPSDANDTATPPNADLTATPPNASNGTVSDQFGKEYTFLVNENRDYRFKVTYEVEEDGYAVRNTISVNYRVDDIGGVTFIGADDEEIDQGDDFNLLDDVRAVNEEGKDLNTLTVKDDGGFQNELPGAYQVLYAAVNPDNNLEYTKARRISVMSNDSLSIVYKDPASSTNEIPVTSDISGAITLSYSLPNKSGRYVNLTFPKYVESLVYPVDDKIDTSKTNISTVDGRQVTHLAIKDGVSGTLKVDFSYTTRIKTRGLSSDDLNRYRKDGHAPLGSFLAQSGTEAGGLDSVQSEIGPITTARNTKAPTVDFKIKNSVTGVLSLQIPFLNSETQRAYMVEGTGDRASAWYIPDDKQSVQDGYIPANYQYIKIYAPTNFEFHTDGLGGYATTGTDPDGNAWLKYSFIDRDTAFFEGDFKKVYLQQKRGTTLVKGQTYSPRKDTEFVYKIWDGENKTKTFGGVCRISTDSKTFVKGDVFSVKGTGKAPYPNCDLIYPGKALTNTRLLEISNQGSNDSNVIPKDDAAGTIVSITLPDGIESLGALRLTSSTSDSIPGLASAEFKGAFNTTAQAVDRNGRSHSITLSEEGTDRPNVFNYTINLSGLDQVQEIRLTVKNLYQVSYTLAKKSGDVVLGSTKADGRPFETDATKAGDKISFGISATYDGKRREASTDYRAKSALKKDIFEYSGSGMTVNPGMRGVLTGSINNGVRQETVSGGRDPLYTLPSHQAKPSVVTIDYPYEVRPTKWTFDPVSTLSMGVNSAQPSIPQSLWSADIDRIVLTLKSTDQEKDKTVEATLKKTPKGGAGVYNVVAEANDLPEGYYVARAEIHLNALYSYNYNMSTNFTISATQPDGSSITAGAKPIAVKLSYTDENNTKQEKNSTVDMVVETLPDGSLSITSYNSNAVIVQNSTSLDLLNVNVKTIGGASNPVLAIKGQEYLDLLSGVFRGTVKADGWEIRYGTSLNRSGSYQISPTEANGNNFIKYVNLLPNEKITSFSLAKNGYANFKAELGQFIIYCRTDAESVNSMRVDPGNSEQSIAEGTYEYTSDSQKTPLTGRLRTQFLRAIDSDFTSGKLSMTVNGGNNQVYQGGAFPISVQPEYLVTNQSKYPGGAILPVGDIDYYIEWLAPSYITLSGMGTENDSDSRFQASLVKGGDGKTYLKISPRHATLETWSTSVSGSNRKVTGAPFTLKLYALPGSPTGTSTILGKVYADVKRYGQYKNDIIKQANVNLTIKDAQPDTHGICGDGDRTTDRLYLLDDQTRSINVLLSALTGVQTLLGKDGQYSKGEVTFTPYQKDSLSAILAVSNDANTLSNYTINVEIPKAGKAITSKGVNPTSRADSQTDTSEYNMYLRGPAQCGWSGSYTLQYRMVGQTAYIDEAQVGTDWDKVDAIRLIINSFPGDQSFTMTYDLRADKKTSSDLLKAYMAPTYSYEGGNQPVQGALTDLSTYIYGNFNISGNAWYDGNENGIRESKEKPLAGVTMKLYEGNTLLQTATTDAQGKYEMGTYLSDGLSVETELPDGTVLTKPHAIGASGVTDSDFDRTSHKYSLDSKITSDQGNIDAGFVYLPTLTANDVSVMAKKTVSADAHVTVPEGGTVPPINYDEAADPSVAHVSSKGIITGKKADSSTTATVWVANTLGDKVGPVTYNIHVSDNDTLRVTAHDWTVIQNDSVPNWWDGVTYGPKQASLVSRLMSLLKNNTYRLTVSFHNRPDASDNEISEVYMLSHPGTYYVKYRVDDDSNLEYGKAIARVNVYGALQKGTVNDLHFAPNGGTVVGDYSNMFHYFRPNLTTATVGPENITVSPSGIPTAAGAHTIQYTAAHPESGQVTASGVTSGSGRSLSVNGNAYTDSSPVLSGLTDRVVKSTETITGLLDGVTARYNHWDGNGQGSLTNCTITLTGPNGQSLADGSYTAPAEPGVYTLTYKAKANQTYANGENASTGTIKVTVKGTVVITAPTNVYATPDQARNEEYIKTLIGASGVYQDKVSGRDIPLQAGQIHYTYQKNGSGTITSVQVYGQYTTTQGVSVTSDTKTVSVTVREIPKVTAAPVHLRAGETFDLSTGVTLTPNDPDHNTWTANPTSIDTSTVGKQTVHYTARDDLTKAEQVTDRDVYVHGLPQITVQNPSVSLHTHESLGTDTLIQAIKDQGGVSASVTYATSTGTRPVNLTNVIAYKVADGYAVKTAGTYKVTLTVDDSSALNPSQTPGLSTKTASVDVFVNVSDQKYGVQFSVNDSTKGSFGTDSSYSVQVVHGKTITGIRKPDAKTGYQFDNYKVLAGFKAGSDVTLANKTVITAGTTIPEGSRISEGELEKMVVVEGVALQAYFSAPPTLNFNDLKLYEGAPYDNSMLNATVTDIDQGGQTPAITGTVDTNTPGTYQLYLSVTDTDGNKADGYAYVQVYGKTNITISGASDINWRQNKTITAADLLAGSKAAYLKPVDKPSAPWTDKTADKTTTSTAVTVSLAGGVVPSTTEIKKIPVTLTAPGQITGHENDLLGAGTATRQLYVHGNPVITAYDNALPTHLSVDKDSLITAVSTGNGDTGKAASAEVTYVKVDGTTKSYPITLAKGNYAVDSNYQPHHEGDYTVTLSVDDSSVLNGVGLPAGITPVSAPDKVVTVKVRDQKQTVKFTVNTDKEGHDKGSFGDGNAYSLETVYDNPLTGMKDPVPTAGGYKFDGYKVKKAFPAGTGVVKADGTAITAGATVAVDTMLSGASVKAMTVIADIELEAYFSVPPTITSTNIQLYEGETYDQKALNVVVSDLDQDSETPVISDSNVKTTPGTYQVKISATDSDNNTTVHYAYVQVYGKTKVTISGNSDINWRQDKPITADILLAGGTASYQKPADIPGTPWPGDNQSRPAVTQDLTQELKADIPSVSTIALVNVTLTAPGQIGNRGEDPMGAGQATRKLFVHGNPVIEAEDNALATHKSINEDAIINVIKTGKGEAQKSPAHAYVTYVNSNGTTSKVTINADQIHYTVDDFEATTEKDIHVTLTVDDSTVVINGMTAVPATAKKTVTVTNQTQTVNFTVNDGNKGSFEGGLTTYPLVPVYGHQLTGVKKTVPAAGGYKLDGYKVMKPFTAGTGVTKADGTAITAGDTVAASTMLSEASVNGVNGVSGMTVVDNIDLQAYFSAPPTLTFNDLKLYEGAAYNDSMLNATVTDIDQGGQTPTITGTVDPKTPGTYQLYLSVTDTDGNKADGYAYVQIYGKTNITMSTAMDINWRQNQVITTADLLAGSEASYLKPVDKPDAPWTDKAFEAAVSTKVPVSLSGDVPSTTEIKKIPVTLTAPGQITDHENDPLGAGTITRQLYVHGNPVITAYDNALPTHLSVDKDSLITAVSTGNGDTGKAASAEVTLVKVDGTTQSYPITLANGNYAVDSSYQPHHEGDYKVTLSVDDSSVLNNPDLQGVIPAGITAVSAPDKEVTVKVRDQKQTVKFSVNTDKEGHDKGSFGDGNAYSLETVYDNPLAGVKTPVPADGGYKFDGYKVKKAFLAGTGVVKADGTAITAGATVAVDTMLSGASVNTMTVIADTELEAYFSVPPTITSTNIQLYEGETYDQKALNVVVSDLDQDSETPVISDSNVKATPGTYQVKISATDSDNNTTVHYAYVQVYGKTKVILNGTSDINWRQDKPITAETLLAGVTASYQKPADIPGKGELPWADDDSSKPAVTQDLTQVLNVDVPATDTIAKHTVTLTAPGQITGREADGTGTLERSLYVHGNPVITAFNNLLHLQDSTGPEALINAIKTGLGVNKQDPAGASVTYVDSSGQLVKKEIPPEQIQYEVLDYTPNQPGKFHVKLTVSDDQVVGDAPVTGITPVTVSTQDHYVDVSKQILDVTFTVNSASKGLMGDQESDTKSVVYDDVIPAILPPNPKEGYHFNGYKAVNAFKAGTIVTLTDGTSIPIGTAIPAGSMITEESVNGMKIREATQLQAFFSASPVISADNIKLYQGDSFDEAMLNAKVADLDEDDQNLTLAYDTKSNPVDTAVPGTYQVAMTVTDNQSNTVTAWAYVQVYGKTAITISETPSINWRQGTDITKEVLLSNTTASYQDPPDVPSKPWEDHHFEGAQPKAADLSVTVPDTNKVQLASVEITAPGGLPGDVVNGAAMAVRKLYIHGNPVITASNNSVYTHLADSESVLIDAVKEGQGLQMNPKASASVIYVNDKGELIPTPIDPSKIQYQVVGFQPNTPGDYVVKLTVSDDSVVGNTDAGQVVPVTSQSQNTVTVTSKRQTVTFSVNSDTKGSYTGNSPSGYSIQLAYGKPIGEQTQIPTPKPGYKLDGFKALDSFMAGNEITTVTGTKIPEGQTVPQGTMLAAKDVAGMIAVDDMKLQAYFSAPPTVTARSVKLYEGDTYNRFMLDIKVSDLDDPNLIPTVDDSGVTTSKPGTYQVKISVTDPDNNSDATYAYVQVYGKSQILFTGNHDISTRQGQALTQADLVKGVQGTYKKPVDLPTAPWPDKKFADAIDTTIGVTASSVPDTDTIRRDTVNLMVQGQLSGHEEEGRNMDSRYLYIHGRPTIVAYDNSLYTHQSTGADALENIIKNGGGLMGTKAASAYVKYVKADGEIQTVPISPDQIQYKVLDYTPLTQGSFIVETTVDDSKATADAELQGITPVQGTARNTVAVADQTYTVTLTTGEHGSFTGNNTTVSLTTVYGKPVNVPELVIEYGYQVDQWMDESGKAIEDISKYPITSDQSIKVSFKLKEYVVKFYGRRDRVLDTQIVKHGYDAVPPTDNRDVLDKRFDGWNMSYKNITKDSDIYALYMKQTGPSLGGGGGGGGGGGTGPGMNVGTSIPDAVIPPPIQIQDGEVPLSGSRPPQHLDTEKALRSIIRRLSVKAELTGGKDQSAKANASKSNQPSSSNPLTAAQPSGTDEIKENQVPAASLPQYLATQTKRSALLILLFIAVAGLAVFLFFKKWKDRGKG